MRREDLKIGDKVVAARAFDSDLRHIGLEPPMRAFLGQVGTVVGFTHDGNDPEVQFTHPDNKTWVWAHEALDPKEKLPMATQTFKDIVDHALARCQELNGRPPTSPDEVWKQNLVQAIHALKGDVCDKGVAKIQNLVSIMLKIELPPAPPSPQTMVGGAVYRSTMTSDHYPQDALFLWRHDAPRGVSAMGVSGPSLGSDHLDKMIPATRDEVTRFFTAVDALQTQVSITAWLNKR